MGGFVRKAGLPSRFRSRRRRSDAAPGEKPSRPPRRCRPHSRPRAFPPCVGRSFVPPVRARPWANAAAQPLARAGRPDREHSKPAELRPGERRPTRALRRNGAFRACVLCHGNAIFRACQARIPLRSRPFEGAKRTARKWAALSGTRAARQTPFSRGQRPLPERARKRQGLHAGSPTRGAPRPSARENASCATRFKWSTSPVRTRANAVC